jgi:hypothetical protein
MEDYLAGFQWHPHRGIETITYVLAGTVEHGDSLGNSGTIGAGDIQWMTAGSGIIHQDMPQFCNASEPLSVPTGGVGWWPHSTPPAEVDNRSLVLFDRGDEVVGRPARTGFDSC